MSDLPVFASVELEEQVTQLRTYLKSLGAPIKDDKSYGTVVDCQELVDNCIVLKKIEVESEVEMVLNSIMSLVLVVPNEHAEKIVVRFADQLCSRDFSTKVSGALLRVLSNLFHGSSIAERRKLQFHIYCALLKVACYSGQIRQVPTGLHLLNQWFDEWKVTVDQKRQCLRLLHTALLKSHQAEAPAKVMIELLGTYTQADAQKAKDDAQECIVSAIADPGTFIFDNLLTLRPVQFLSQEKIYQLLQIFVSGTVQDYEKFRDANRAFLDTLNMNDEANVHKMRILTLMTLGEQKQEYTFAELSQHLRIPIGEDLEEFVIRAVQSNMVKAKIDQTQNRLIIGGVKNRTFGQPQWDLLATRLDLWAANLSDLKKYLATVEVQS